MLDVLEDPSERQMLAQDEGYVHSLEVVETAVRGKSYLEFGQYDKALRIFEKLVQIDPNFIFALNHLSLAYYALKNIKKARETAQRVLEMDPVMYLPTATWRYTCRIWARIKTRSMRT
jgi:tetratricopeptide (TPR) repeat protein